MHERMKRIQLQVTVTVKVTKLLRREGHFIVPSKNSHIPVRHNTCCIRKQMGSPSFVCCFFDYTRWQLYTNHGLPECVAA